ncbi:hypothetical protein SUGI_1101980 [Cryptomeria japonica]|nr:hypothetical protein SUGI_1101980 [Cryptomeria japonica]
MDAADNAKHKKWQIFLLLTSLQSTGMVRWFRNGRFTTGNRFLPLKRETGLSRRVSGNLAVTLFWLWGI